MSELDRTAWAKEAHRIEKQIAHRYRTIKIAKREAAELEGKRDELLKKIADDYNEE